MKRKYIVQVLFLGAPLLAGAFSEYLIYIADSVMVGQLGTEYLAAIAIATIFAELLWLIVWPITAGTQAIAARRYGQQKNLAGRRDSRKLELAYKTGEVLPNSILISLFLGLASFLLSLFSKSILCLLLKNENLILLIDSYIRIIRWIMLFHGIFFSIYGFLAAINSTKVIMTATVMTNVLNIVFNYILIFGKLGFPALGIKGAAIGTLVSQLLGVIYLFLFVALSKSMKAYKCLSFSRIRWRLIKDIFITTYPLIVQGVVILAGFLIYESIIGNIGVIYLAVTHIVVTVFHVNQAIITGFAEGGSILIGNALGRGDQKEAIRFVYAVETIAFFLGLVISLVIVLFPTPIIRIFNSEVETVAIASKALRFFAAFGFIASIGYPFRIIFNRNGWGWYVLYIETSTTVIFIIGLTLLLTKILKIAVFGAWLSYALYLVFFAGLLILGFISKRWLNVKVERSTS